MTNHKKMAGKKVLVTGSGTGIGREIALEFSRQGAEVVLHYSHSETGARSAIEQIHAEKRKAAVFRADFNDVKQAQELVIKAIKFLGGLDVLVNNAGITMNIPFEKVNVQQYDTLFNVNMKAMFFVTQQAVSSLSKSDKPSIINLTSINAYGGLREHTVYASTKGAILSFTRVAALELAKKGIRVNAIAPGWIRVENQEMILGDNFDWDSASKTLPAGFIGSPIDVAHLAVFLASDEARYIIGQCFITDGGQMAILPNTGDFRESSDKTFGKCYVPDL